MHQFLYDVKIYPLKLFGIASRHRMIYRNIVFHFTFTELYWILNTCSFASFRGHYRSIISLIMILTPTADNWVIKSFDRYRIRLTKKLLFISIILFACFNTRLSLSKTFWSLFLGFLLIWNPCSSRFGTTNWIEYKYIRSTNCGQRL